MSKKIVVRKSILVDTGFWIALYDSRDQYHESANSLLDLIQNENILIPWPTLYEFLNTRFSRRSHWIEGFTTFIARDAILIDDSLYKETALGHFLSNSRGQVRYSLVDLVLREILADLSFRLDYLVSFNSEDFLDICQKRGIEILTDEQ